MFAEFNDSDNAIYLFSFSLCDFLPQLCTLAVRYLAQVVKKCSKNTFINSRIKK